MSKFERPSKKQRRVVVTGMGMLSPVGNNLADSWKSLVEGQSGIGLIESFDTSKFAVKIAGEVRGFDPETYIPKKEARKLDRYSQLTLAATHMAIEDAGITFEAGSQMNERTGVFMGVGIGGMGTFQAQTQTWLERGPDRISPFFIPQVIANMAAGHISIKYGLRGGNYAVVSACASGAHALGEAARYIRDGIYDVMVAGGAEAAVVELGVGGFSSMKALSTRNEQPTMASRPFDRDRDGFVLSEGSGVLILEDLEHAEKRGARIYAELTGYGLSSDAHHMTNPAPEGRGAQIAMRMAFQDAGLNPEQIGYVNAHGTSTPAGDGVETQAIKAVFGSQASKVWVSSTKSMTGHTLGAAGAIEGIISVMALKDNIAPPTINLDNPSEDCDLDYIPHTARNGKLDHVLSNSFGFGGTNASLIFSKL